MLNIAFETSSLTESEVKALRALLDTLDTGTSRPKVAYGYVDPEARKLVRTDPEPSDPETVPLSAGKEAPAAEEAPAKPRRKRRTKAEMEAARAAADEAPEEAAPEEAAVDEAAPEEAPEEAAEESTSEVDEAPEEAAVAEAPQEAAEESATEEAAVEEEAPEESEELSEAQREEQYAQIAKMVRAFSSDPEKRPKAIAILRRLGLQSASEIRHRADLFEKLIEKLSELA